MNKVLYGKLKQVAKAQNIIFYSDVAPLVGLNMELPSDRNTLAELLGDISKHELSEGRPLLSAVVVLKESHSPGKGFFTMAKELGLYDGKDDLKFHSDEPLAKITFSFPTEGAALASAGRFSLF